MRKFVSKKSAVLGLAIALVAAVSAYAFLSAGGSGSGSGSVVDNTAPMTLTSSALSLDNIGDSQVVNITAANPTDSPQVLSTLDVVATPSDADCPAGSFTATQVTPNNAQVPANGSAVVGTARITFVNQPAAQNDCLGADAISLDLN